MECMATAIQVKADLFLCPICLEKLKVSRSLPCLHTFCEQCISEYILSAERRAGQRLENYQCPVCRAVVTPNRPEDDTAKWATSLPYNFTVSSLMETSSNTSIQECHTCKRQEITTAATQWCTNCSEAFCDQCLKMHKFMKLLMTHKVIPITEINTEVDLSGISEYCPVHSSKVVEAYCFDHEKMCCVSCLTLQHRKCENIKAIEDVISDQDGGSDNFDAELSKINEITTTLLKEKATGKVQLENSFVTIKSNAIKSTESIKEKLDDLLRSFLKNLELTKEDQVANVQGALEILQALSDRLVRLIQITNNVDKHCSKTQLFIYLKRIKPEIKDEIQETLKKLNQLQNIEAKFNLNDVLQKIESIDTIGQLLTIEKNDHLSADFARQLSSYGIVVFNSPDVLFTKIYLKKRKTVFLDIAFDYLCGGTSISNRSIAVCTHTQKLSLVDIETEKVTYEYLLQYCTKRLAYNEYSGMLYVSCYASTFQSVDLNKKSVLDIEVNKAPHKGGICIHGDLIYLIVGSEIKTMNLKLGGQLKPCFQTLTDCTDLNGLAFDSKNERLIYTTQDFKVVCTSLEGQEIFSYKDTYMTKVTSVTVNSNGIIFVGDETGLVHAISEDGKQRKTILDKCDKIKQICDVWLDKLEKTLFVCGDKYIEIYDIMY